LDNSIENAKNRANYYALFSRLLLQEVDSELLKNLRGDSSIKEIFPNLKEWEPWDNLPEEELINQHLNVDFTNLSLLHLVPYETFYTREDGQIETGGANPVTDFYHEFGFKVEFNRARVVSPDHIGIELEFFYKLIEAEIKALEDGNSESVAEIRRIQKEFMKRHIINWVALYLINFKYEARTPLYHDLGEASLAFLLEDNEYLNS
jgi:TorA maturation chaperone TorD